MLLQELTHLRLVLIRSLGMFVLLFFIFFAVPFTGFQFKGLSISGLPMGTTVATWAIAKIQADLVPKDVQLISVSPLEPFLAQSSIAATFAFLLTLPFIMFEFWRFVSPGLLPREKKGLHWFFFATVTFFLFGAIFSYAVLLPLIISGLYSFSPATVVSLYGLRTIVSFVTSTILITSIIFLLPIGMVILSKVGFVKTSFWRVYARHAIFVSILFSAIITPDGSGLSMIVLAVPISVLYGAGYIGSVIFGSGRSSINRLN